MSCDKNNNQEHHNNHNHQNYQNNKNSMNSTMHNNNKTSAEIAAEQWDSWTGNPDDHEITNNVSKDQVNP